MRLLLDENFPNLPGFFHSLGSTMTEIVSLHDLDPSLTATGTPDWYLYLRASEEEFDALVTRDKSQAEQPEEMWALSRTKISVVTWRKPIDDPVRLWGQLLAYLPDIRQVLKEHTPSIVLLPATRLSTDSLKKPSATLGIQAKQQGISNQEIRSKAQKLIMAELRRRGEETRFPQL